MYVPPRGELSDSVYGNYSILSLFCIVYYCNWSGVDLYQYVVWTRLAGQYTTVHLLCVVLHSRALHVTR